METLSATTANPQIDTPYPHLMVEGLTDALTVVIDVLRKGDLPLLVDYQGTTFRVADIHRSPLNISKLLRLTQVTLYRSETDKVLIRNNLDLMEAGVI